MAYNETAVDNNYLSYEFETGPLDFVYKNTWENAGLLSKVKCN